MYQGGVCGIKWSDEIDASSGHKRYWLKYATKLRENNSIIAVCRNFVSESECGMSGYNVTHAGHCGSCSTLQDLGVYMRQNLTAPTRQCGALGIISHSLMRNCLQRIGFSPNCVPIWEYNILNTRKECWEVCMSFCDWSFQQVLSIDIICN